MREPDVRRDSISARGRAPVPRAGRGFTLAEVLIVVVLLGVLAAIGYPAFSQEPFRVKSAASSLASTLLRARRLAVTRGHDVAVLFRPGAGGYLVHEDADNDGRIDPSERTAGHALGDGVAFGRGESPAHPVGAAAVTFGAGRGGRPAVVFHRSGAASEEGGVYLTGSREGPNSGAAAFLLVVDRATGRTSSLAYRAGQWSEAR